MRAREIVSEAFDRGVGATPQAAEAREHCRTCEECRTFVEGLSALAMIAPPSAPPALVDDIVDRARKMAEAGVQPQVVRAVPRPAEPTDGEAAGEAAPARRPRTPAWWVQRAGIAVAAAAVLVLALSISIQGFRQIGGKGGATAGSTSVPQASVSPKAGSETYAPADPHADGYRLGTDGTNGAAAPAAAAGGPRYISFDDEAYAWLGDRTVEESSLIRVGTVTSSLDGSGTPISHDVWRSKSDPDIIFVPVPIGSGDGSDASATHMAFKRVERERGGKTFVLQAGTSLTAFGVWPTLPSTLPTPTASDGYPTFVSAGRDDSGLEVFAPAGASADEGFAVPPDTAGADPAAGDPNWTWWLPKKTP